MTRALTRTRSRTHSVFIFLVVFHTDTPFSFKTSTLRSIDSEKRDRNCLADLLFEGVDNWSFGLVKFPAAKRGTVNALKYSVIFKSIRRGYQVINVYIKNEDTFSVAPQPIPFVRSKQFSANFV